MPDNYQPIRLSQGPNIQSRSKLISQPSSNSNLIKRSNNTPLNNNNNNTNINLSKLPNNSNNKSNNRNGINNTPVLQNSMSAKIATSNVSKESNVPQQRRFFNSRAKETQERQQKLLQESLEIEQKREKFSKTS